MKYLLEKEYEEFFSPKTMANLKAKSGENAMLGNKSPFILPGILAKITKAEYEYRDELEALAVEIVKDNYPIIDYANIRIDAKIVNMGQIKATPPKPNDDEPSCPTCEMAEDDMDYQIAKTRVINGITQGAAVRGGFSFLTSDLFEDYIKQIGPELVNDYTNALKISLGIYDKEEYIAMLLAAIAMKGADSDSGGQEEIEYDEENEQFVIKAQAINFPMLVHEIVKGLYEIIATAGFTPDKAKNQAMANAVDKLEYEPRDIQYGKFIYDALNNLYTKSKINDSRVREYFIQELEQLPEDQFFPFIENAINNELTPQQTSWANKTLVRLQGEIN
jgi:hypothetical protein